MEKLERSLKKTNKLILKTLLRFRSKKHIVFMEEIKKTVWNWNYDKRIQSIDSVETYAYRRNKDL